MLFTYRLAFYTTFVSTVFNLFYLIVFGSMFLTSGNSSVEALSAYGMQNDFISYIIIGSIGWGFLWSITSTTGSSLRSEMMMGTIESILLTPTKLYTMMVSYAIFGGLFGALSISIIFVIGYAFFGVTAFATATIFTVVLFFLSILMMFGIGMIFSGLTIWIKNIGETIPLVQSFCLFFSGVYFPVTQLPEIFQPVAKFIPFYYSIEGLRLSLISTTPASELIEFVVILAILAILSIVIGLITLKKGLKKAKKEGSLGFY
jgi:ABC-type polysaccharide/polyol phosphate export permease